MIKMMKVYVVHRCVNSNARDVAESEVIGVYIDKDTASKIATMTHAMFSEISLGDVKDSVIRLALENGVNI